MKTHNQNHTTLGGGVHHNLNTHLKKSLQSPHIITAHEHVRTKSYLYSPTTLTLLVLVIFLLISCGVNETTSADTGGGNGTPTPTVSTIALQQIIESGNLAGLVSNTDPLVTTTLSHLTGSANYTANTEITAIYATETGAGNQSGTHWTNAVAATNLRNKITNITDATASKVYAVLVAGGTYKPTYDGDRNISFAMKNHVAVIGGFATTGSWEMSGITTFSGDIGDEAVNSDNTYQVFSHNSVTLNNALLYGVTVTGGNANDPNILEGGGMYNNSSSPRLINVVFTGNSAQAAGGGMYNSTPSTSVLIGVVFSNNSAKNGGGMFNVGYSDPVLTGVVFNGNRATGGSGGGMYNFNSSPVLVGVVFNGNSAKVSGGGMYNDNNRPNHDPGPLIVNVIFASNTAPTGQDIGMTRHSHENIRIAGSVLGIGANNHPTSGIVGGGAITITYHSLSNTAVNFGHNATLGGLTYPTIQGDSSAKDLGLYVRRSGTDYYFSENTTAWYTNFTATGGFGPAVTLPTTDVEDLTARDIAGNVRVGRPDAGVYEYKP